MDPAPEQLTVRARSTAGVSSATFAFERDGVVYGHAIRRDLADGRVVWHITDRSVPPFVVERQPSRLAPSWLLSRPDGIPFARVILARDAPLEIEVLDADRHRVRLRADGTLLACDGDVQLGSIELHDGAAVPDGVEIELPAEGDPVLRAALLTIPLCLLPAVGDTADG